MDRVVHATDEKHPIDAAIDRRFPERALRAQIKRVTSQLMMALGPHQGLWQKLEAAINDLKNNREEAYFNLGFEHGFAAGRSDASSGSPHVRELAARVRDLAIQHGSVDEALAAVVEAAQALATRPVPPANVKRASEPPTSAR